MNLSDNPSKDEALEYAKHLETKAKAAERKSLLGMVGVEDDDDLEDNLKSLSAQAADGKRYRETLLEQLGKLTITAEGNDEKGQKAAERAKKVWSKADTDDIKDEVTRLTAKVNALVPDGPQSNNDTEEKTPPRPSASAYG